MLARCWLLFLAVAGCVEAKLQICGDLICGPDAVCLDDRCAAQDQIDACDGRADNDTCTVAGVVGRCDRGVCVGLSCGDGDVDPTEACDDGNQTSGDGCRADCQKVERCDDSIVDDGEGCDDGNENAGDGCDACAPTAWSVRMTIGENLSPTDLGLGIPTGLAIDPQGNVFASNTDASTILRFGANGFVSRVIGSGTAGYSGDGGFAVTAQIATPHAIAVDGLGQLYIADRANHRIRKIDTNGVVTTVAGTGAAGFNGDGGPAIVAGLNGPEGVVVDGLGRIYVADTGSQRVRRIDTDGTIITIAGGGNNPADGPALATQLTSPTSIALDAAGQLYIVETLASRIRRVDGNGMLTTFAGGGGTGFAGDGGPAAAALLNRPHQIAFDASGRMYIADTSNSRIRRIENGTITTFAGTGIAGTDGDGGPASAAQLARPEGVTVSLDGHVYIADTSVDRIRVVDPTGTIHRFAGTGGYLVAGHVGATSEPINAPAGLCFHGQNLVVAMGGQHQIRELHPDGTLETLAGSAIGLSGDGGPATQAKLQLPVACAVDSVGNLYFSTQVQHRVRKVDTNGTITTFAGTGIPGFTGDDGPANLAQLSSPTGLAVDAQDRLYIADSANQRVRRVENGTITTIAGSGLNGAPGDEGPAILATLPSPRALAFDASGQLYIGGMNRVRFIDDANIIHYFAGTIPGNSGDGGPATAAAFAVSELAFDPQGRLLIADHLAERVRRIDTDGTISTIAGGGTLSNAGEGGPAVDTILASVDGVAVDAQGRIFISNAFADRIQVIVDGKLRTVAGKVDPSGVGPIATARLADPRAIVHAATWSFVAGGSTGTLLGVRAQPARIETIAGRFPQSVATGSLARFRDATFGTVGGVAYDGASIVYITESTTNRVHAVTIVDPAALETWVITPIANPLGMPGSADGASAQFRNPMGLWLDAQANELLIADTGNHTIRAMSLATRVVRTIAGTPAVRGLFGDGGPATSALLHSPEAVTRCPNGDVFVADTANHRVRRLANGMISTVLGDGAAASSGEGAPASAFSVQAPRSLACDTTGNLFIASSSAIRLLPANAQGIVDGTGRVQTIYGAQPRDTFPASETQCLSGIAVVDNETLQITDACTGLLVELHRDRVAP